MTTYKLIMTVMSVIITAMFMILLLKLILVQFENRDSLITISNSLARLEAKV